ncbi:hypothetical protein Bca4012_040048 [Brassica carinata]|uniref:Uncharacterized protein n=1 Tax=Brassica carinata TaxID=52824 RepID=A0A8X7WBM2_BRACI|nr:hypothetical protein Bca52824_008256 [Brassica carinata]
MACLVSKLFEELWRISNGDKSPKIWIIEELGLESHFLLVDHFKGLHMLWTKEWCFKWPTPAGFMLLAGLNSLLRLRRFIHQNSVDLLSFFIAVNEWAQYLPFDMHIPNLDMSRNALVDTGLALDGRLPFPTDGPGHIPPRFGVTSLNVFNIA